ncbi:MAG: exonuclease domain-containing protein, partial [Candidatus Rokubacteria bacterium]|nr:exonuclease domain-containing protein [Candidatus Rokubacteria bacterium]
MTSSSRPRWYSHGLNRLAYYRLAAACAAGVPRRGRLVLARAAFPDLDAHKLADLVAFFELDVAPEHRALADAEATAALLLR